MNGVADYLSIGSLVAVLGVLIKGYTFIQSQAREDESIKNRIRNLEFIKSDLKDELKEFKIKNELDYRLISDKMDKNSESINSKIDELKDMLFDIIKNK